MFAFCKLFFCHDNLENVAGIDLPAAKQRTFNHNIQYLPILRVINLAFW